MANGRERERLAKEACYSERYLECRILDTHETLWLDENAKPAYLRRKPLQGKPDT